MRISVFGLGYVGTVCAGCLAATGHTVVGVDINQAKVDLINSGSSPIVEPGVDDLINRGHRQKTLWATTSVVKPSNPPKSRSYVWVRPVTRTAAWI